MHAQAEDGKCGKVPKQDQDQVVKPIHIPVYIYFLFLKYRVGFVMLELSCCLYLTMESKNQYLACW